MKNINNKINSQFSLLEQNFVSQLENSLERFPHKKLTGELDMQLFWKLHSQLQNRLDNQLYNTI